MKTLCIGAILVPALASAQPAEPAAPPPAVTVGAWVETFYAWNFRDPSNRITNFRGFDNRHNSLTLQAAAIDAQFDAGGASGRVTLQTGLGPSTYYLAEPSVPGTGSIGPSGAGLLQWLQQAYVGVEVPGTKLTVQAGLFLSPIGPESMQVKDDWAWSRSNLFFALPFYHSGARASYQATATWVLQLCVFNGWNNIVDNNDAKSVALMATYTRGTELSANLQYFGGIERADGAPEGDAWRHLFDAYGTWQATPELALQLHLDAGVEPNDLGTDAWVGAAAAARLRLSPRLFAAARADFLFEDHPDDSSVLLPVDWLASGALTLDARPVERASIRLEYRHDQADADLFFGGDVMGDGVATPFVPNREAQDTVTLGFVTWL
jgi:hypothetical protein